MSLDKVTYRSGVVAAAFSGHHFTGPGASLGADVYVQYPTCEQSLCGGYRKPDKHGDFSITIRFRVRKCSGSAPWVTQAPGGLDGYGNGTVHWAGCTFSRTSRPAVVGKARVGRTLTARPGRWSPKPRFSYRWLANGKKIKSATHHKLTLTSALRGKRISVTVSATRNGYVSVARTAARTKPVAKR